MVDLSPGASWQSLVSRPAPPPDDCGGLLVVPGDPKASYLYQKLSSPTPCYGSQMPASDFGPAPLPSCVIDVVARWIAAGAPNILPDGSAP